MKLDRKRNIIKSELLCPIANFACSNKETGLYSIPSFSYKTPFLIRII